MNGKGNCQDAENAARESVQVFPSAAQQVQKTPYVLVIPLQSGVILNKTGRFRDTESYLRQAVETRTRLLPKGVNQLMSVAEGAVGECLTTQRCFLEAEPWRGDWGVLYQSWGKSEKAARYRLRCSVQFSTTRFAHDLVKFLGYEKMPILTFLSYCEQSLITSQLNESADSSKSTCRPTGQEGTQ